MKLLNSRKRSGFGLIACLGLFPVMAFAAGQGGCVSLTSFDGDGDGAITAEEVTTGSATQVTDQVAAFLAKYDGDADGTVTTEEAESVFAFISADWLEDTLAFYDTDGDGAITSADYAKLPKSLRPLLSDADVDGDNALSAVELQAAADEQTADRLARFLVKYDSDSDGSVTTAEITTIYQTQVASQVTALLAKYDSDGDGAISAAEVEAASAPPKRAHRAAKR